MLPTGSIIDTIDGVITTCIDVGNPCVFVTSADLGVPGDISPDAIEAHPTLLTQLDSIRRHAGLKMGLAPTLEDIPGSIPKIAIVSPPSSPDGGHVVARALSVGQPHRAVPITVALAIASAARIPGSTVHNVCAAGVDAQGINIAHPSGKIMVSAKVDVEASTVAEASVMRTARLLMKGEVFWPEMKAN